jgi:hypothetical protein
VEIVLPKRKKSREENRREKSSLFLPSRGLICSEKVKMKRKKKRKKA